MDEWLDVYKQKLTLRITNNNSSRPHGIEADFVNGISNYFSSELEVVAYQFGLKARSMMWEYHHNGVFVECRGSDEAFMDYLVQLESDGWRLEFVNYA